MKGFKVVAVILVAVLALGFAAGLSNRDDGKKDPEDPVITGKNPQTINQDFETDTETLPPKPSEEPECDDVIVEVKNAVTGKPMNDVYLYVRTSDPSGAYYMQYYLSYDYVEEVINKSSTVDNVANYRIKGGHLVKVSGVTDNAVNYTVAIRDVLQNGGIECAIQEKGAADFIGSFHGDVHMSDFSLLADDVAVETTGSAKVVKCREVKMCNQSTLTRFNSTDETVAEFRQLYIVNADGIYDDSTLEWKVDDFTFSNAFLFMFPMSRYRNATPVCDALTSYDGEGNVLGSVETPLELTTGETYLNDPDTRRIEYSGKTSGVSAVAEFALDDDSTLNVKSNYVSGRVSQGDNKWYVGFKSAENGMTPAVGEIWHVKWHFHIDYTKPEV